MNYPNCGKEMKEGYLFTTKDGAFSFADEVPRMMKSAKDLAGFIEITPMELGHRVRIEACCCEACRLVQFRY